MAEEDQNGYELPTELVEYVDKYFNKFVPDKEIKDSVLFGNPVPSNIQKPKSLDDFYKDLLEEKRKRVEQNFDDVLTKLQ